MAMALDSALLSTRAAAEAYVGGVCFKLGPPRLIGAELEWLTVRDDTDCPRPDLPTLASALGHYAPKSIAPSSPARPLPGGSYVTVEPGGQIEISSAPFPSAEQLCRSLKDDEHQLRALLATKSIRTHSHAADADRLPHRLLQLPRYAAMESVFDANGPFGKLMMCNTAATQVSLDAGVDAEEVARRWATLNSIGPALLAAFACSPTLHGAPAGQWASQRMRTWFQLDPSRTAPPLGDSEDPLGRYASWVLDVPLLCVVRDSRRDQSWAAPEGATFADWLAGALDDEIERRPTFRDLDYHLTTVFPPVRAAGHLEVRYIDAQPGDLWTVPIAAFEALMSSPEVVAEASALSVSTAHRWWDAAEFGLADGELRSAAEDLLELAAAHTRWRSAEGTLRAAARRCRDGRMSAEEQR